VISRGWGIKRKREGTTLTKPQNFL